MENALGVTFMFFLILDHVVHMATTVLNGSNETTILSKIDRSGLHIAHFDTSLSNSNVVQIIR